SQVIKIENMEDYFDELKSLVTFKELEEWLLELVYKIIEAADSDKQVAPKHLIPQVKQWIEEAYQRPITFQQFADEHHVSLSYLSREFKEQTGMTFSEYLTRIRIHKAKELFINGLERTVEVGELVGYHDMKHFRTVFKRETGLTPASFKESVKRGEILQ